MSGAAVRLTGITWNTTSTGSNHVVGIAAQPNDLIIVLTGAAALANAAWTLNESNNGAADVGVYTQVLAGLTNASADSFAIYVRKTLVRSAPLSTFSLTGSTLASGGGGLVVICVSGMLRAGLAAIRSVNGTLQAAKEENQVAGTPAPTFAAAADPANPIIGFIMDATNGSANAVERAGYTERFDQGFNTPPTGIEVMTLDSGETASAITWGGATPSAFGSAVIELDSSDPNIWVPFPNMPPLLVPFAPSAPTLSHQEAEQPVVTPVAVDATITAPLADAAADAFTPTVQVSLLPPIAACTADALTPTILVTLAPDAAAASADAFAPTVTAIRNVTISAPVAEATADAPTPTPEVRILAPLPDATADAPTPTVLVTLVAPSSDAIADADPPAVSGEASVTVDAPRAEATADAPTPTPKVTLLAPVSDATADALVPTPKVTLVPATATATADALAPSISTTSSLTISAPTAEATADAPTPVPKVTLLVPLSAATADALVPTVSASVSVTISAPCADAAASALTPTPTVTLSPGVATSSGDAITPTLLVTLLADAAEASSDAIAPTITGTIVTISAPCAAATADAPTPSVRVSRAGATLVTGGGFDLTTGPYRLVSVDLGQSRRVENWFQPAVRGSVAQLASTYDTPTQMTIHLRVTGTDVDDLVANLNAIRDEFSRSEVDVTYGGDNWIEYGLGPETNHIVTHASAIDPVDLADVQKLMLATAVAVIPDWSFQVWRDAQYAEDAGSTRVIVG